MLAYFGRTLPVLLRSLVTQDGALVSRIDRRVGLRHLDINRHMNQAVYAQVMELGRTDWFIRSGAFKRWRGRDITAVVASQTIVYRRELGLGTRYTLDTRALGMNGRLLRLQTNIVVGTKIHARNDTELIFIGPNGVLAADDAQTTCDGIFTSPLAVEDWRVVASGDRT